MDTQNKTAQEILAEVKIYVGTYKKYNDGSIYGKWLSLGNFENINDFYNECKKIHFDEDDPELMFQDYEAPDIFKSFISESYLNSNIFQIAEALENKDLDMIEAFISLGFDLTPENIEEAGKKFFGEFENYEKLGEEYAKNSGIFENVPDIIKKYFDFEKYGESLSADFYEFSGYYFYR